MEATPDLPDSGLHRLIDELYAEVAAARAARLGFCPTTRDEVATYLATDPDPGHARRTFERTVAHHGDRDTARHIWTLGQCDEILATDSEVEAFARRIVTGLVA